MPKSKYDQPATECLLADSRTSHRANGNAYLKKTGFLTVDCGTPYRWPVWLFQDRDEVDETDRPHCRDLETYNDNRVQIDLPPAPAGVALIVAGCRCFTYDEAVAHWTAMGVERQLMLPLLEYIKQAIEIRGWVLRPKPKKSRSTAGGAARSSASKRSTGATATAKGGSRARSIRSRRASSGSTTRAKRG
jgi:hypothetical protein